MLFKLTAGLYHVHFSKIRTICCLFVPHRHDDIEEAVATFDGNRTHDIIDFDEHVVDLKVLERVKEEVRIE